MLSLIGFPILDHLHDITNLPKATINASGLGLHIVCGLIADQFYHLTSNNLEAVARPLCVVSDPRRSGFSPLRTTIISFVKIDVPKVLLSL